MEKLANWQPTAVVQQRILLGHKTSKFDRRKCFCGASE